MPSFFPWVLWVRSSKRAVTIFCFALAPFLTSACGEKGGAGQRQGSFAAVDQQNGIVPQLALDLFGKAWVGDPPIDNPTAGSLLSGGRIFIADAGSLSLRIFSEKGDLLKNIGREGGGPGEFQSLPWVRQCAPDSLFVWDPILGRVRCQNKFGRSVLCCAWLAMVATSISAVVAQDAVADPDFSGGIVIDGTRQ